MSTTTRAHCSATRGRRAESVSAAGVSKVVDIIVPRLRVRFRGPKSTRTTFYLLIIRGGRADMWLFSSYPEEQTGRWFPGRAGQCTGPIHPAASGGYLKKSS